MLESMQKLIERHFVIKCYSLSPSATDNDPVYYHLKMNSDASITADPHE